MFKQCLLKTKVAQKVFLALILLLTTISVTSYDVNYNSKLVEFSNGDMIVSTDDSTHYAIVSPNFAQLDWRAISVNGDDVVITGHDGQSRRANLKSLTIDERHSLETMRHRFEPVLQRMCTVNSGFEANEPLRTAFLGRKGTHAVHPAGAFSSGYDHNFHMDGQIFRLSDDSFDFEAGRDNLPNNWTYLSVRSNVVTTVTKDGRVIAKMWSSLNTIEQEQIKMIRDELKGMVDQWHKEFSHRMQQKMNELQEKLNHFYSYGNNPDSELES